MAEKTLQFEHWDLHWGNILVERMEEPIIEFTLKGKRKVVLSHGVRASIIDFTRSRVEKGTFEIFTVKMKIATSMYFLYTAILEKKYFHSFTHIFLLCD